MGRIYLLPGTGADKRLFSVLDLGMEETICLEWMPPHPQESLKDYALRLAEQIDTSQSFSLIGVSLGGMLAVEIGKRLPSKHIVLISSLKTADEKPWYYHPALRLRLHKLFPARLFRRFPSLTRPLFGAMNRHEYRLYAHMLQDTRLDFLQWAMQAILEWDNREVLPNIIHLHGTKDRIFPIKHIRNCLPVEGGQHFMVVHKAREISRILKPLLHEYQANE